MAGRLLFASQCSSDKCIAHATPVCSLLLKSLLFEISCLWTSLGPDFLLLCFMRMSLASSTASETCLHPFLVHHPPGLSN